MCPICLEFDKKMTTLSCTHKFCSSCINKWLVKNQSCPICRIYITDKTKKSGYDRDLGRLLKLIGSF